MVRAFPERLCRPCRPPFYQALGQLAQATLAQWQENLPIAVAQNRSIVNPSPRRYPARFYFAASQPFTRTYRFCI
nr:twin-argninine leader-binding protein DmsD [Klebsiella pneumoniae]